MMRLREASVVNKSLEIRVKRNIANSLTTIGALKPSPWSMCAGQNEWEVVNRNNRTFLSAGRQQSG